MALKGVEVRHEEGLVVFINGNNSVNRIKINPEHVLEPKDALQVKNVLNICFSHSFEKLWLKKCE